MGADRFGSLEGSVVTCGSEVNCWKRIDVTWPASWTSSSFALLPGGSVRLPLIVGVSPMTTW